MKPHIPQPEDDINVGGGWETIGAAVVLSVVLGAVACAVVHVLLLAIK
jgi:hypothetical protein